MSASMLSVCLSGGAVIDLDGTFVVQLAIFFIALIILRAFVFKPLLQVFDAREEAIDGAKKQATLLSTDTGDKEIAFNKQMHQAKLAAAREREKLRGQGLALEKNLLEKVRKETNALVEESKDQMIQQGEKVRTEIHSSVPQLASQIVQKVLEREAV